jgi:hypothetical protein
LLNTTLTQTLKEPALANKHYISIIRLFNFCDINLEEEVNISRIKKQLLAEFALTQTGIIELDGYSYNKNDVLQEIELPNFLERLNFHKSIWENKSILGCLEDNTFKYMEFKDQIKKFHNNIPFDEFFSPYFSHAFTQVSRNLIADLKIDELSFLLLFEEFILVNDREEAFKPIRIFLDENYRLLKNVSTDNYTMMKPKIALWVKPLWSRFFNNLPTEFDDVKHSYVVTLINVTVAIQKTNKTDCKIISKELTSLKSLAPDVVDIVYSNHKVYTGTGGSSGDGKSYWWLIWLVFLVIRIGAKGC